MDVPATSNGNQGSSLLRLVRWGLIGAMALGLGWMLQAPGAPLKAGTVAPGLALTTLDGSPLDLREFQGKPTLINFFATWCGPCRQEIPELNGLHQALGPGVNVVGLAVFSGAAQDAAPLIRTLGIHYPVWVADDASAARWQVSAVPASFLVDAQGVVRWSVNGMVRREDVLGALQGLEHAAP